MKRFLGLSAAFMLVSTPVIAEPGIERSAQGDLLTNNAGETIKLPSCHDSTGAKVRFSLINSGGEAWGAFSGFTPLTGPTVSLDARILSESAKVLQFVTEHECAHHNRGHIRDMFMDYALNNRMPSVAQNHDYEHDADCVAARVVQEKHGYEADDIIEIFEAFPPNDASKTHPPTSERVNRAINCLNP